MALKALQGFAEDLNSLVNKHGAVYDEFSSLIGGGSLDTITDNQINAYYGTLLSANGIALIRLLLGAMENHIPLARETKDSIDASEYSSLDKLTK